MGDCVLAVTGVVSAGGSSVAADGGATSASNCARGRTNADSLPSTTLRPMTRSPATLTTRYTPDGVVKAEPRATDGEISGEPSGVVAADSAWAPGVGAIGAGREGTG